MALPIFFVADPRCRQRRSLVGKASLVEAERHLARMGSPVLSHPFPSAARRAVIGAQVYVLQSRDGVIHLVLLLSKAGSSPPLRGAQVAHLASSQTSPAKSRLRKGRR